MTSKTSLNNPMHGFFATWRYALYKTRGTAFLYIGMLALFLPVLFALICGAIHTSYTSYVYLGNPLSYQDLQELTSMMQLAVMVLVSTLVKLLTTVFTVTLSVQLLGFMHKKRSVDTFHALPVRRIPLLLGNMAAILSVLLVPVVAAFLITGVIGSLYQALPNEFWLQFMFPLLGDTLLGMLACFAFVLFMLVASGTVMDAVVSALILSVAYPVLYSLVQLFLTLTVQGYSATWDLTVITALSPFAAYFSQFVFLIMGMETVDTGTLVMSTPWGFTLWWFFAAVALLAGALWLYARRKSEHAESTYAFAGVKETMKFLIAAACAFALGFIAVMIYQTEMVFIVFALLGGFAANTAVEALYSRGLRRFGRGCITYGAFAAAFLTFYGMATFGMVGYAGTMPAAKDVSYITVDSMYYTSYYLPESADGKTNILTAAMEDYIDVNLRTSDGRYISALYDAYESPEDIEAIRSIQKLLAEEVLRPPYRVSDMNNTRTFTINYHLKNGGTVIRTFRLPWDFASDLYLGNAYEYDGAERQVIEMMQDVHAGGVRAKIVEQILTAGNLADWSVWYEEYVYEAELNALENLSGAAYDERKNELYEKYGDGLYAIESYEAYAGMDRDGAIADEMMEILRNTPAYTEGTHSTGHVNLEFCLRADEVDSPYIQMLTKGHDDAYLRIYIYCNFGSGAEELVEFVKANGEAY